MSQLLSLRLLSQVSSQGFSSPPLSRRPAVAWSPGYVMGKVRRVTGPLVVLLLVAGCGSLSRVADALDSVSPITSAPPPVRSPKTYVCQVNAVSGEWECITTSTEDGSIIEDTEMQPTTPAASAPVTAQPSQPAVVRAVQPASPASAEPVSLRNPIDEILGQSAEAWTVQLIVLSERDALLAYASEHGVDVPLTAPIRAGGSTRHVLLLGIYADRKAAEGALEAFRSQRALSVDPWIRQLGPLQDAIRLARAT